MGRCRPVAIAAALLVLGAAGCAAKGWGPASFPDPKRDVNLCGRKGKKSNICDPDGVIAWESANRVEGVIKDIWNGVDPYVRAPCADKGYQGYQVGVALMQDLEVAKGEAPAEAARRMAKALHAKWGVGDAACDNGVLLLLATRARQVYISTGAGAQKPLTDDHLGGIISGMRKSLRAGDYDAAVEQAVVDIGLGLAGRGPHSDWEWFPIAFFGAIGSFMLFSCWSAFKQRRQYRNCRQALRQVKDEQEKLRSREWSRPRTCPVCLEPFTADPEAPSAPPPPGEAAEEESPSAPLLPTEAPAPSLKGGVDSTDAGASCSTPAGPSSAGLRQRGSTRLPSKGAAPGVDAAERQPITLACGHTFCEPCIDRWLEAHNNCPICRARVDGIPGAGAGAGPSSSTAGAGAAQQRPPPALADNLLNAELAFRLMSLRQRYPAYITPSLIDTWTTEAQTTGTFDWEAARDFQLRDPAMRAQHQGAGASGHSASFGGGGGGGGGGAGGSW